MGRNVEGGGQGLIEVLPQRFPGGTEENNKKYQTSQPIDSNQTSPEHKTRALLLHNPVPSATLPKILMADDSSINHFQIPCGINDFLR